MAKAKPLPPIEVLRELFSYDPETGVVTRNKRTTNGGLLMATLTGYKKDSESLFIDKDPEAVLIYTFDWTNWLGAADASETISTSNWSVDTIAGDSDPIVVSSSVIATGNKKAVITLTGGTAGNIYTVRNIITTSDSQTERKFFRVVCKQKSF